jgi:hypothetical protein
MRKMLLSALLAASVSVPAVALAVQANGSNAQLGRIDAASVSHQQFVPKAQPANPGLHSIGGGMQLGDEPGHSAGPGSAKVDGDARGPVNDIQVGRGTNDVPQSKNPVPVQ